MPSINFVPSADASVVSEHSRQVLRDVLADAGLNSCVITSTVRSPARQASAMYANLESTSVARQLALYGPAGDEVIGEYQRLKPNGHGRQLIVAAMADKINLLGPGNVSRHCADPTALNVIDIAPSSIANSQQFLAALQKARTASLISRFFSPANGDPAFHIEIPQPTA
ncbi:MULTISPECIES: hypothetical protein [unclassified Variovorax]|uniref:hypothetical protein n=1 Tax=unclassified Variovorax TaxID=663243 RepID=UPI001BD47038|nr:MULTISPECIES: hypothetical protein [unclassified Variovorax]